MTLVSNREWASFIDTVYSLCEVAYLFASNKKDLVFISTKSLSPTEAHKHN